MTDRLQALLDAERDDAHTTAHNGVDDAAFATRVVGALRGAAGVAVVATATTSTTATAATTTSTAAATTATTLTAVGIGKLVAVVGVVTAMGVGGVVIQQRARGPVPVVAAEGVDGVDEHRDEALVLDAPTPSAVDVVVPAAGPPPDVAPLPRRARPVAVVPPTAQTPTKTAPTTPTELERYDEASKALREGRFDDAVTLLRAVLVDHPRGALRPETQLSLVESLYRAGRFEQVVTAAAAAIDDDASRPGPHQGDLNRLAAEAHVKLHHCAAARATFEAALDSHARQLTDDDVTAAIASCERAMP